jgi:hypothetical protein
MDAWITSFINSNATTLGLLVVGLFAFARGWVIPITWFNRLLKAKDEIIAEQARIIEQNKEVTIPLVKLLEKLNEKVDSNG